MSTRIAKLDEYQFLLCIKYGLWGSRKNTLSNWKAGDFLILKAGDYFAALAIVEGESFENDEMVWDNDLFPFRIKLKFIHLISESERPVISEKFKKIMLDYLGPHYGWTIVSRVPIREDIAGKMISEIYKTKNGLSVLLKKMDFKINEMRKKRALDKNGLFNPPLKIKN